MLSLPLFYQTRPGDLIVGRTGKYFGSHYRIAASARSKHMHVIGRTGQGKSKALENFLYQDIANGLGVGLIDPHSSLIDNLLRYLITTDVLANPDIQERIVYIQPTRKDYVIPFNVLATPDEPYMVASAVIEAFRRTRSSLGEASNFSNVMRNALLVLIKTKQSLIDFPRLFEDMTWRDQLLAAAADRNVTAFFHNRYDQWGREAHLRIESSLNKVTEYILNPYLELMLGQEETLDLRAIMDEGKILLLYLGQLDPETRRLLGSLMVTLIELRMRKRQSTSLWPLTIDEFAQFMASEGSATTLAHVLSEARKYGLGLTAAHQTLSQLTPTMLGALANTDTRLVFGVGRYDAEWLSKVIGRVDTEAVKREPKTETQHTHYDPLAEQWEKWVDCLRLQSPRQAWVTSQNQPAISLYTVTIPEYTANDEQVEAVCRYSLTHYGIAYKTAKAFIDAQFAPSSASRLAQAPLYDPAVSSAEIRY